MTTDAPVGADMKLISGGDLLGLGESMAKLRDLSTAMCPTDGFVQGVADALEGHAARAESNPDQDSADYWRDLARVAIHAVLSAKPR